VSLGRSADQSGSRRARLACQRAKISSRRGTSVTR
jgi:hypothetical protein